MIATGTRTAPWLWRALAITLALLASSALGARVLSRPPGPLVHTILVGGLPDALALDASADRAFVASDRDATVSVLDLATDRVLRTIAVGDPSASAPLALALAARTHHLVVANRGDNGAPSVVRLLDSRSGVPLATIHVGPEATALAVDERAGRVLVTTEEDGRVSLLDARSGAVLHSTRVGLVPLAVAVDPRTGRLPRTLAVGVAPRLVAVAVGSGRVVVVDSGGMVRAPQGFAERWRRQVVQWAPWLGRFVPRAPDVVRVPGSAQVIDPGA